MTLCLNAFSLNESASDALFFASLPGAGSIFSCNIRHSINIEIQPIQILACIFVGGIPRTRSKMVGDVWLKEESNYSLWSFFESRETSKLARILVVALMCNSIRKHWCCIAVLHSHLIAAPALLSLRLKTYFEFDKRD